MGLLHIFFPVMGVVVQSPVQKAAVSEYYILVVRACVLVPDCGHGLLFNTYIYVYTVHSLSTHVYTVHSLSTHVYTVHSLSTHVYTVHSLSTQSPSMIIHPCTLNRLGAAAVLY